MVTSWQTETRNRSYINTLSLNPAPQNHQSNLHFESQTLKLQPCIVNPTSQMLKPCTLHLAPCTLRRTTRPAAEAWGRRWGYPTARALGGWRAAHRWCASPRWPCSKSASPSCRVQGVWVSV